MPWKQADPEYTPDQYPKALNEADAKGKLSPARYPVGHPKQGAEVVFDNEDEEKEYLAGQKKATNKKSKEVL